MRYKIIASLTIIVTTIALVGGATMAWFTDSAEVPEASFTAGTVEIKAGQTIKADEGIGYREYLIEANAVNPSEVVSWYQGSAGADEEGKVRQQRSGTETVKTYEKGDAEINFFSLGFGGHITVEFQEPISNRDAIVVVEDTWGLPYPLESAKVYVGDVENDKWYELGTATNKDKEATQTINFFMVDIHEDFKAKYVKLVDTSKPDDFVGINDQETVDGFDVNAIMAINSPIFDEENWNPGDRNIRAYYVTNVGTKDIYVRAKLSGQWFEYKEDDDTGSWVEWKEWTLGSGEVPIIKLTSDGWVRKDDYFYYNEILDGTYDDRKDPTAELVINLHLVGEDADNDYQGKKFVLSVEFEAVQSSHNARSAIGWDLMTR